MEKRTHRPLIKKPSGMLLLSAWLPSVSWMTLIFFLSSRHSVTVSPEYVLNFLFFKTLHVIEYAILFAFNARGWHVMNPSWKRGSVYGAALMVTLGYAMTDEYHQLFVPSRTGQPRDVIIDLLGVTISWLILSKLLPKAPNKLRRLANNVDILF